MNIFSSFRIRLLLLLALMLIATLSVQYYLNMKTQEENIRNTEMREQALLAGFALGVNSIPGETRLTDFIKADGKAFYTEQTSKRIKDILVIDDKWRILDALQEKYMPYTDDNDEAVYLDLRTAKGLPPLMEGEEKLGEDINNFPNSNATELHDDCEAHTFPVETDQGRWYVMVIIENDRVDSNSRVAQSLLPTLAVLLLATLGAFFLVWRFTRPITNLSKAAKRVAGGDLNFRLSDAHKSDEMGRLAMQFNEMTAELEKTRELQAQLQEAEKSAVVGRLASAIAHEIRNPLNYINLSLDHLRKKFKPEVSEDRETFEKLTTQLKMEVERINQQISDFLRYSRPIKLDLKPTQIRDVIKNSMRIVEPQAAEQDIKISVVEREDVPTVKGDAEVLRSVFNNLFINSVQSMENAGGKLSVVLSSEEEWVRIEVKDTGGGIPEENLSKIFQPYFSTKETGTGLGLAITKKIVDDHGGRIEVESELGTGTCFTVLLPESN